MNKGNYTSLGNGDVAAEFVHFFVLTNCAIRNKSVKICQIKIIKVKNYMQMCRGLMRFFLFSLHASPAISSVSATRYSNTADAYIAAPRKFIFQITSNKSCNFSHLFELS